MFGSKTRARARALSGIEQLINECENRHTLAELDELDGFMRTDAKQDKKTEIICQKLGELINENPEISKITVDMRNGKLLKVLSNIETTSKDNQI